MTSLPTSVPAVSAVADVLALWGRNGWLTPPLAPVVPAASARAGRAITVRVGVGDSGAGMAPLFDILSAPLDGAVVVLTGGDAVPGALWGEILALATHRQGAVAALVHGAVRDVPDMQRIGLPMYAVEQRVVGPNGRAHVVAVDEPVDVAGTLVAPGDTVVVDPTGCVRVAAADATAVLEAATMYATAEAKVVTALEGGAALASAYHHKRSVIDELRR